MENATLIDLNITQLFDLREKNLIDFDKISEILDVNIIKIKARYTEYLNIKYQKNNLHEFLLFGAEEDSYSQKKEELIKKIQ